MIVFDDLRRTVPMSNQLPKIGNEVASPTSEKGHTYSRCNKASVSASPPETSAAAATISPAWWKYSLRISVGCTLCVVVLAVLVAALKPDVWEARQSVVVRPEAFAGGLQNAPANERRQDLQNTFVTVIQSQPVLESALKEVGPLRRTGASAFPTLRDIDALREAVKIAPVAGDEFGSSDAISVRVRDRSRPRAVRLTEALVRHADQAIQELQARRMAEMTEELTRAQHLTETALHADQTRLEKMEADLGADGITLRLLEEKPDTSGLRSSLEQLDTQIQQLESRQLQYENMLEVLSQVRAAPSQLQAVPSALLEAHPTLRRLQEALTEAEVRLISLEGQYAEEHPAVIAARLSLDELRRRIAEETPTAIEAVQHERALIRSQLAFLRNQRQAESARIEKLMALLPEYRTIAARVRSESQALESIRQQLNQARAAQAAVASSRFIVPVEPVQTGAQPVGPGRQTIIAGGVACGLMLGVAVFLWLVPAVRGTSEAYPPKPLTPGPALDAKEGETTELPQQHTPPEAPRIDPTPALSNLPVAVCDEPSLLHRALIQTTHLSVATGEVLCDH